MLSSFGRGMHVLRSGDDDLDNVLRKLLRPFSLTTIYFKRILYLHAKRLSKGAILTQYRRKEKGFKRNSIQLTPFFADNTSHVAEAISLFSSFSPAFHSKSIYFSSIFHGTSEDMLQSITNLLQTHQMYTEKPQNYL